MLQGMLVQSFAPFPTYRRKFRHNGCCFWLGASTPRFAVLLSLENQPGTYIPGTRDHQPSSPPPPVDQQQRQQRQQKLVAAGCGVGSGSGGGCWCWLWWWWRWASICRCCFCCRCQFLPGTYLVPRKITLC